MSNLVIIQARMSSNRFPGKVLAPLAGVPMIVFMARRLQGAKRMNDLVVATSSDRSDDPLANTLAESGIRCFRGDLLDVLDRFYQAARSLNADRIVRLTGDCPLMDADLVDRALDELCEGGFDYVSNIAPPSYPDGLDVEAFTMQVLHKAWSEATLPSEREHVTPYLRSGRADVRVGGWQGCGDMSSQRWTVDYPDDLDFVRSLVDAAGTNATASPDRFDFYRAIERFKLRRASDHVRNEGYLKSLEQDAALASKT